MTHRLWVPIDVISAASPDAVDVVTSSSRVNKSGSIDVATTYRATPHTEVSLREGAHLEENFRSVNLGVGVAHSFAEDNATLGVSLNHVYDWFERNSIAGGYHGRNSRSSTNANLSLSQLLGPTTVALIGYGATVQLGELGNTWSSVPLTTGARGPEILPSLRHRHALSARLAQALPWRGVLKGLYRFYVDGWGLLANTVEAELYQRLGPWLWVRANYRFHHQTGVDFYRESAPDDGHLRTADSDLAPLSAHTVGGKVAVDLTGRGRPALRDFYADVGYERYFRTNGLHVNVYTCAVGFRF